MWNTAWKRTPSLSAPQMTRKPPISLIFVDRCVNHWWSIAILDWPSVFFFLLSCVCLSFYITHCMVPHRSAPRTSWSLALPHAIPSHYCVLSVTPGIPLAQLAFLHLSHIHHHFFMLCWVVNFPALSISITFCAVSSHSSFNSLISVHRFSGRQSMHPLNTWFVLNVLWYFVNWILGVLDNLNTWELCELDKLKMLGELSLHQ